MRKTYVVAIGFAALIALWMLSGLFKHKDNTPKSSAGVTGEHATRSTTAQVRVRHMTAKPERLEVVLRGRTEAKRVVQIKAEMGGRVVAVPVEKGQRVKAGAVLCQLADDDHKAHLALAQAALEKASIDYEGALKLREKNLLSASSVAAAKAGMESAKANLKSAELAVDHLSIRAPFAAYVEDRPAQVGDLIERSMVCARLMDESTLLITAQASEREVATLDVGSPVTAQLATGGTVSGKVSFIARTADPMTRTYRVEATLSTKDAVRDGITAQLSVPMQETMAYRITPAILALDDAGQVGVRLVNKESKVEFHHVQVVRESADGVWVAGLPPEIDLITVGQEFVAEGDKVQATPDTTALFAEAGKDSAKPAADVTQQTTISPTPTQDATPMPVKKHPKKKAVAPAPSADKTTNPDPT